MSGTFGERRVYLSDFLSDFGFSPEARNAVLAAFDVLFASQDAIKLFDKIRKRYERDPDTKYAYLIKKFDKIAAKCGINRYTAYLVVLILLSESSREVYAARDVSPEMWRANMFDLKYRCDNWLLVEGVYGNDAPEWYERFFAATRFTFGKLQFEMNRLGEKYEGHGVRLRPDDQVIFIHIPRTGERLMPSDVEDSVRAADDFFRKRYGITDVVFACHSWMLYPENKRMLSETSNIYSFISRFEVIDVREDTEYKDVWRLFDRVYRGNVDELPQDTSLRRAYADRIRAHLPLGVALGVWVYR